MNLYVLRHGIAVDQGTPGINSDADRPLTPKGERKTEQIAKAMLAMELSFDVILSSPFVRAKQTAEIIAAELKSKKRLKFSNALAPGGDVANLFRQLKREKPSPE